ncbi:MAG: SDR family oxidoreductase [Cryobacterium sp.]
MILVVGATGQLGGRIARRLLERGDTVRVLVRDPSASAGLAEAGADIVVGDLRDKESLRRACAGVSAVVTTANSMSRGGEDTVDSVDLTGNANLIDAAAERGVKRFVFVSALGADVNNPMPFLRAKAVAEQKLRDSGMAWTALQPNGYMELLALAIVGGPALAGQPVTLVGEGRRRHSLVSMSDVAEYAALALGRADAEGQVLVIGGPEPVSWRDVIAAFEKELGRDVPVRFIPIGSSVPGMPDMVAGVLTALESYDSPLDTSALAARYGITPTSLGDLVHGFVAEASRTATDPA